MLLAGDVGGTKTSLGLFEPGDRRPGSLEVFTYPTATFGSLTEILDAFARDVGRPFTVDAAVVGVAGPVVDQHARLTNVDWDVSANEIATFLGIARAGLMNDLEAMANGADILSPEEVVVLQAGRTPAGGNAVVIAAGTGLGQAYLYRIGGRLRPFPSEGGHADFAPRSDREIGLLQMLRAEFGRAEVEHVLSGPGLLNLHRFTHAQSACSVIDETDPDKRAAAITQAAMAGRCPACVEALSIFVSVLGAESGNLALRGVATAGVYVGGGIAPKILPALQTGEFIEAFRAKGEMSGFVSQVPVKVMLNPQTGLLGAAVRAQELLEQD